MLELEIIINSSLLFLRSLTIPLISIILLISYSESTSSDTPSSVAAYTFSVAAYTSSVAAYILSIAAVLRP